MNLIINGIEAMKDVDGIREMVVKSQRGEDEQNLVSVAAKRRTATECRAESDSDVFKQACLDSNRGLISLR